MIDSVSKAFAARSVLKNISLDITNSQSTFVCGINGAGKSTLLRVVSSLLRPDEGSVHICNNDIHKDPEKTKHLLGMISHQAMVYSQLTVFENLMFFANLYGVKKATDRIGELLRDIGLSSYKYDRAGILSRGLLQRLSIARALLHAPAVLIADEPFTGLDREGCQHLISIINDFKKNNGTVLITTHDVNLGLQCSDRVVVLDKANIVFDDMTSNIDTESFAKDYILYSQERR